MCPPSGPWAECGSWRTTRSTCGRRPCSSTSAPAWKVLKSSRSTRSDGVLDARRETIRPTFERTDPAVSAQVGDADATRRFSAVVHLERLGREKGDGELAAALRLALGAARAFRRRLLDLRLLAGSGPTTSSTSSSSRRRGCRGRRRGKSGISRPFLPRRPGRRGPRRAFLDAGPSSSRTSRRARSTTRSVAREGCYD